MSGIKAGIDNRTLTIKDGLYYYRSNAETTGFGKLIKDYKIAAEAILDINDSGINPLSYKELSTINGSIQKNIKINSANGDLDPLSLFLVLSNEIQNNPTKTQFAKPSRALRSLLGLQPTCRNSQMQLLQQFPMVFIKT